MHTDTAPAADTDADLMAAAEAADRGQPPPPSGQPSTPAPEVPATPGDTGRSAPPASTGEPATKPTPDPKEPPKPESAYTKAQKDRERFEGNWKKFQEEKEAFRAEKEKTAAELAQLRAEVQRLSQPAPQAPRGPAQDEHGASADTYDALARRYEGEGNSELAEAARARAAALRKQEPAPEPAGAPSPPAPAAEPWKTPEFQQKWQAEAMAIVKARPELGDPDHPVFKAVHALVNQSEWAPMFRSRPEGIRAAVEVAQLQQSAAQADGLRKELETAKAEIQRLNTLTQPTGAPPAPPAPAAAKPEDMSDKDLLAAALEADRSGGHR